MCLSAIWSPKPQLKRHLVIFSFYLPFEIQYGVTIARSKVIKGQFKDINFPIGLIGHMPYAHLSYEPFGTLGGTRTHTSEETRS